MDGTERTYPGADLRVSACMALERGTHLVRLEGGDAR